MSIKHIKELRASDAPVAGGKGASLGEMTRTGINVPPGFVILTDAFNQFLQKTDIGVEIDAISGTVNTEVTHTIDQASEKIQGLILAEVMPQDLKDLILEYFDDLDAEFVAVRSSATAEDGASAAWAGQLDSFLNTTRETLLHHVQKCWASLFTPRAIYYRFEKGMDKDIVSVAVVVQKMVNSEKSGIAFSVHPVTQDEDQMIIEAGFGLGEAIVSGQVTPDSYVVRKSDDTILDINVHAQARKLIRKNGGGSEWVQCEDEGATQVLTQDQILELGQQIKRIEHHYQFPVDVEWAFESNEFFITQSRPITTLGGAHLAQEQNEILELYQQTGEPIGSYQISLPMLACTRPMTTFFPCSYGDFWVYFQKNRITNLIQLPHMREVSEAFFKMAKNGIPAEWTREWKQIDVEMHVLAREIGGLNLLELSADELWNYYMRMFDLDQRMWAVSVFIDALDPGFDQEEIKRIQDLIGLSDEDRDVLLAPNVPAYITKFENLLVDLREGKLRSSDLIEEYYWIGADYGAFAEVDEGWLNDRAKKAERHLFISLKGKQTEILKKHGLEKNPLQAFQDLGVWRDDRKILNFVGVYGCVRLLREGLRRQEINPDYVNFLCLDDVRDVFFGNISSTYLEKRNREGILYTIHEDGSIMYIEGGEAQREFKRLSQYLPGTDVESFEGVIACPGKVVGRVCYADTPESETAKQMQKGDVLVTSMTRPEFVPLMRLAGAIVTDEGGISSHAAIVSREMSIPCVIGTKIATKTLKHGDLVEVDATRGIVNILERASLSTVDTGLHSEEYVYYGFWKQKLLTNSYWAYSYSQEIIDQMGLRMTVPGSLIGTGGHVLAHKDVIYAVRQQWGERIVARDQVFFEHCKEVTDRVLNDALARVDELSSASISSETFEKIDRVLNDINFIWLLGAGYFVVEAEARLQEKVIEKQVPAELVLQLIPTFKTMFTEQQDDVGMLRKLAHGKTKQEIIKDKNIMDKVDEHIQQFAWIETANFIGGPFTKESLIDLVVSLSGSDHHVTNTEYIPDEELSFHLSVMSISGYIKQICAETFSKASFMIRPFFERLAQQMEISYQDLINLSRNEIRADLEGRLSVDVIRQTLIVREKSDYLLYRTESEDVIIENDSAARVFLGKIVPTADTNAKELTGTTGNPGKITGEVCIVLNSDDFHKFKEGNILVSTMTTPDFVVLMQKSAAIVTDIGGLLCHAAIVSRELKKPCVIGTKFATQVLKDGDLVEVDAHTGRVRML